MGLGMMIMAWVVLLGLGVVFFGDVLEKQFNPNQRLATAVGSYLDHGPGTCGSTKYVEYPILQLYLVHVLLL